MLRKVFIGTALLATIILIISLIIQESRRVGSNQGYEPDQPIAYSHKVHAGDNKIPCLYCHFGAEQGRHAGIPPANVCMNCHSKIKKDSPEIVKLREAIDKNQPIDWIKVHRLPDFAYFNHSQHVTANVPCQECHGPVETMTRMRQDQPLTMGWCISCHRERGIMPPEEHQDLNRDKTKAIGGMDCAKCHY